MSRSLLIVLFVAAACTAALIPMPASAGSEQSVNLGMGGGQFMKHCRAIVYLTEYERLLGPQISVLGRASGISYKFDDSRYQERGRPRGVDLGARYYLSGGMKGFFLGGSVGYWMADWRFTDDLGRTTESKGNGDTDSLRVNLDMGARIPLGSSGLSIMPAVNVGRFFSSTSCDYTAPPSLAGTPCSQDTEVQYYVFWAVMAGFAF